MYFLFLDESGNTRQPSGTNDIAYFFALGGLIIHEKDIRTVENYIEKTKRQVFGEEYYTRNHPELKATNLYSKKHINNKQRQNFARLISDKIQFYHNKGILHTFGVIFDKRKATIYQKSNDTNEINMWYYNLGIQKLLFSVSHFIENRNDNSFGVIVIDRNFAEKSLSESLLIYLCGNPVGKKMSYMLRHPLFGESKNSPMIQLADFIVGTLRFWEEYEDEENKHYEKSKLKRSKLPYANSKIRKSEYYVKGDETKKSIRGISQAFK